MHMLSQDQVTQAAQILIGSPPIFASTSNELFSRYNIPSTSTWMILALKDRDALHPTSKFSASSGSDSAIQEPLRKWILDNRLPTTVELTQDTFQEVMKASHRPLVVIAAVTKDSRDKVADKFKDIGKVWRVRRGQGKGGSRDVVFTWMDTGKWASWMKSMYGISLDQSSEPAIVIADHAVCFPIRMTDLG
jgi:thioredoxin domain-containing protein 5